MIRVDAAVIKISRRHRFHFTNPSNTIMVIFKDAVVAF